MSAVIDNLRAQVQQQADTALTRGGRLAGLTDQHVADTLIRDYFHTLPDRSGTPHLIDVGAAYGSVAEVFLQDGWTADMFEPDPACQRVLARLPTTYPGKCRLFPMAAGARNIDSAAFHLNTIPGLSGLTTSPFGADRDVLSVRCVRLADFLPTQHVQRVDFLKIDTEGTDFHVLQAYDLQRLPPRLIFIEYSFYFAGQTPADLLGTIDAMTQQGYNALVFDYDDGGNFRRGDWTHRLVAVHADGVRRPDRPNSFGNVLFYRNDDERILRGLLELIQALNG